MEKDWIMIYQADEEYKAEIVRQKLESYGLHPVLMDKKDDEFRIGQVEIFIAPEEAQQARRVLAETTEEDE